MLHAVSLFSNCGAGDVGYAKAGFTFDVMAELDPRRLEVCLLNHSSAAGVAGDLRDTWKAVVKEYRSKVGTTRPALLAACPPCQGMSTARSDRGLESDPDAGMQDERNLLVTVIAKVARELKPRIIVVENVPAFLTRLVRHPDSREPVTAARLLIEFLQQHYAAFPLLTDLCHYGVPQTRKRTFLTFIHQKEPCIKTLERLELSPYPKRTHDSGSRLALVTVKRALMAMKLPKLDARSASTASSTVRGGLHEVPVWSAERYAMVAAIPRNGGGSAWETQKCRDCGPVDVGADAASCPRCGGPLLRPVVVARNGRRRLIKGFRTSTYRRMRSDKPASTITTASGHVGSNLTIHPYENRLLSTLECALLQTIPRTFQWGEALKKWGHTNIREMIGEAVPPKFTNAHGKVLRALVENRIPTRVAQIGDRDCKRAAKNIGLAQRRKSQ